MARKFFKNVLIMLVFMLALSAIVFWLARLAPGDPLFAYHGDAVDRMSESQRAAAMTRLALDRPIAVQYVAWLENALQGEFGISYQHKQNVLLVIGQLWFNTLLLGGASYLLTFVFAALLGVFCAAKEGGAADRIICRVGTATSVIPAFFIALMAILVFGVNLQLLPTSGAYSIGGGGAADRIVHLILPVSVLVLSHLWYYAYMIRNRVIEELRRDYVLLLQVKRLSGPRILLRHCLRNALPMIITIMAVSVPHIIAGTYVVEMVFGYPGLGTLTFESARYQDYNMLSVLTLLTGFIVLVSNLAGQTLSEWLDPRMRSDEIAEESGDAGGQAAVNGHAAGDFQEAKIEQAAEGGLENA